MNNHTGADLPPRPTIKQAAEFHGVDEKTVRRWIAQGRLIAYRVGPRLIRLDRESVVNYGRRIGASALAVALLLLSLGALPVPSVPRPAANGVIWQHAPPCDPAVPV